MGCGTSDSSILRCRGHAVDHGHGNLGSPLSMQREAPFHFPLWALGFPLRWKSHVLPTSLGGKFSLHGEAEKLAWSHRARLVVALWTGWGQILKVTSGRRWRRDTAPSSPNPTGSSVDCGLGRGPWKGGHGCGFLSTGSSWATGKPGTETSRTWNLSHGMVTQWPQLVHRSATLYSRLL